MTAPDAVYGFVQWLSGRPQATSFGLSHDSAPAGMLAERFLQANDLAVPDTVAECVMPDDLRHSDSIYGDSDRSNGGQSFVQFETLQCGDGSDFDDAARTGWGDQAEHHDDVPLTWSDLEQYNRWVYRVLAEQDYMSLHLALNVILHPDGNLTTWAEEHDMSPQAASQRLRRIRAENAVIERAVQRRSSDG